MRVGDYIQFTKTVQENNGRFNPDRKHWLILDLGDGTFATCQQIMSDGSEFKNKDFPCCILPLYTKIH